jgi:type II secretion system protein C
MTKKRRKKRFPVRVSDAAQQQIVALALQNPGLGPRRLVPLLEKAKVRVAPSTVYAILKRHDLQNREKRLAKLKVQARNKRKSLKKKVRLKITDAAAAAPLPEAPRAFPLETAEEIQPPAEEAQPLFPVHADEAPNVRAVPVSKRPLKTWFQGAGIVTLFNIALLALLAYLGFYTVQNLRRAAAEPPEAAFVATAPAAGAVAALQSDAPELDGYRRIWERNLFNVSGEEAPAQQQEIPVEKLALAENDLGLTLVGTVAADDARLRRAFIDNSKTHKQEAYREGDTAGEVRIKKILRNRVVVATREGDRILSADILQTGRRPAASPPPQPAAANTLSAQPESGEPEVPMIEARLNRAEVETGLSEDDYLMKQVLIYPYTGDRGEQLEGFRISNIRAGNVLLQMGFRSGDVITGVNGRPVMSPGEAAGFFERLTEGGDLTIDISRRRQPLKVRLSIG